MRMSLAICHRQRGVATVLITVVLLLAVALIALYTSRSAIFEQRLSANEVRAKQALAAGNAGIDHALARMRNGGLYQNDIVDDGIYTIDNPTPNAVPLQNGTGMITRYRVAFVSAAAAVPDCPATSAAGIPGAGASTSSKLVEALAVACGWSDDDTSVQRVTQMLEHGPSLAGSVSTPLIARGGVNVSNGNASVFNFFNDLTVWSGGQVKNKTPPGKTYLRDLVGHPDPSTSLANFRDYGGGNNVPSHYVASSGGGTLGHDLVMGDSNLSDLNDAAFFAYFMGASLATYRDTVATVRVDSASITSIQGMTDKVIWVEGSIGANSLGPSNTPLGTREKPVILVINGNFDLNASPVVNGLIFVTGKVTGTGSPTIFGGLVSSGAYEASGAVAIVYDPNVLGAAGKLGPAAKVPGTWRDW